MYFLVKLMKLKYLATIDTYQTFLLVVNGNFSLTFISIK